jgi:PAS domain S-box-containing protein
VFIHRDITAYKRLQERLVKEKARAEHLALIAKHAAHGMAVAETDLTIRWANDAFEQLTEHRAADVKGRKFLDIAEGPLTDDDARAHVERCALRGVPTSIEMICYTATGRPYWAEITISPVRNAMGDLLHCIIVIEDISARKELEEEIVRHRDELSLMVEERTRVIRAQAFELEQALAAERELNQMQNKFISMVSHEFRTPLTIIDGTAQRLERKADGITPDQLRERAHAIRSTVARLAHLVERTLDASRLAANRIDLTPSEFGVRELIKDVCARQKEISPEHAFTLDLDGYPERLVGDQRLLDHVFANVVSNAAKYSAKNPVIEVRGGVEGGFAVLRVKDYGVGVPREEISKLFQQYVRAKTSTGIPGTGVGLHLVKMFVEMHHGWVRLDSEEGRWTEVTIALPLASPLAAAARDHDGVNDEDEPQEIDEEAPASSRAAR